MMQANACWSRMAVWDALLCARHWLSRGTSQSLSKRRPKWSCRSPVGIDRPRPILPDSSWCRIKRKQSCQSWFRTSRTRATVDGRPTVSRLGRTEVEAMGARFDLYAPSAPEGLDVPKRFDSIRFRAFVHLEIGPEAYREGDTLGFPPAEWPESKLDAVKSGCE